MRFYTYEAISKRGLVKKPQMASVARAPVLPKGKGQEALWGRLAEVPRRPGGLAAGRPGGRAAGGQVEGREGASKSCF